MRKEYIFSDLVGEFVEVWYQDNTFIRGKVKKVFEEGVLCLVDSEVSIEACSVKDQIAYSKEQIEGEFYVPVFSTKGLVKLNHEL